MEKSTEQQLIENVKSLTDRMGLVDEIFRQLRVGRNMVLAFQCGHTGLFYPGDYLKEWGRKYGIGLGPTPVSEALDTDYNTPPPEITRDTRSLDSIMHPVGPCMTQLDAHLVEAGAFAAGKAILHSEDPYYDRRIVIIRAKQMVNPASKLPIMAAKWAGKGGR